MKKLKFIWDCMDKHTRKNYDKGSIHEFEDVRADEIVATGYAKVVEEIEELPQEEVEVVEEATEEIEVSEDDVTIDDISFEDEEEVVEDGVVKLSELSKPQLIELAKECRVSTRGTKEDIIKRLLEVQAEQN